MFHDQRFINKIDATPGCARYALPSGHWFMVDEPDLTLRLMSEFLQDSNSAAEERKDGK
jgi:hypothetical protein